MPSRRVFTPDPISRSGLNEGLVAWYLGLPELSQGAFIYDIASPRPATVNGSTPWIATPDNGQGLTFDGTSPKYAETDAGVVPVTVLPITISCWFRVFATSDRDTAVCISVAGASSDFGCVRLTMSGSGTIRASSFNTSASIGEATSANSYTQGVWSHGVAVFTSATSRAIYLNGVIGSKGTDTTNIVTNPFTVLDIGVYNSGTGGVGRISNFNGSVADVRVYNRALSDAEAYGLYEEGLLGNPTTLNYIPSKIDIPLSGPPSQGSANVFLLTA